MKTVRPKRAEGLGGNPGLVDAYCPHRGAPMFFGRNEEDGLRCVYHGWKFDVNGTCVDLPNAPEGDTYKDKVKIRAYPSVDRSCTRGWTSSAAPARPLIKFKRRTNRTPQKLRRARRFIRTQRNRAHHATPPHRSPRSGE